MNENNADISSIACSQSNQSGHLRDLVYKQYKFYYTIYTESDWCPSCRCQLFDDSKLHDCTSNNRCWNTWIWTKITIKRNKKFTIWIILICRNWNALQFWIVLILFSALSLCPPPKAKHFYCRFARIPSIKTFKSA